MAEKQASLTERVQTSYKQLVFAATNLNIASDELSLAVSALDRALANLKLGVSAWATISSGGEEDYWWSRDVGYTQFGEEWSIALRSSSGNHGYPEQDTSTEWRFSLAPRWMQNEAVAKIPDLLDKLTVQAQETRTKLKNRAKQVSQLAAIVEEISQRESDWLAKLRAASADVPLPDWATAIAQPEAAAALISNVLKIRVPKRCQPGLNTDDISRALKHLGHPDLRFKILFVPDNTKDQRSSSGSGQ